MKPKELPVPEVKEEPEEPPEENLFWKKVGYKPTKTPTPSASEEEEEEAPKYIPPMQIMKTLIHSGVMRRVRMSKEKSEYKQIIFPNPDSNKIGFVPDVFGPCLPSRFWLTDKKVKECKEVKVDFKILN